MLEAGFLRCDALSTRIPVRRVHKALAIPILGKKISFGDTFADIVVKFPYAKITSTNKLELGFLNDSATVNAGGHQKYDKVVLYFNDNRLRMMMISGAMDGYMGCLMGSKPVATVAWLDNTIGKGRRIKTVRFEPRFATTGDEDKWTKQQRIEWTTVKTYWKGRGITASRFNVWGDLGFRPYLGWCVDQLIIFESGRTYQMK